LPPADEYDLAVAEGRLSKAFRLESGWHATKPKKREMNVPQQISRTSRTHPLEIAEVPTGPMGGVIGITFAPGKKQALAASGAWDRDLESDLDVISAWNAAAVITLLEPHEFDTLQIRELGREVQRRNMEWHHWPIADASTPSFGFETDWQENSQRIQTLLETGSRVLIHCKGGLGRAGMIAARCLVQSGVDPAEAL
jgi:protein-tyrosine phosphatase